MDQQTILPQRTEPFASGAITGAIAAFVLTPFDLIKTRSQADRTCSGKQLGFLTSVRRIVSTKGPTHLYNGVVAQSYFCTIFYSCFFGSYSLISDVLKQQGTIPEAAVCMIAG
jgi:hypothetical protein